MDYAGYEDGFGAVGRRLQRLVRALRWRLKGLAGRPRQVLVETRWRLGDEIMALPIYEALKTAHPATQVAVLCNFPDLLDGNPHVDVVNPGAYDPDRYILLRGTKRDVQRLQHYANRAGVPKPATRPRLHFTDWSTTLLEGIGGQARPLVAVSTGATWSTKRWPIDRWQAVCQGLETRGFGVVQLGRGDPEVGVGLSLMDRTSVREAACVLRQCRLLVCGDSGLMHLALAVGTPVVALFGPTDPVILVEDDPDLTVIGNGRECFGCWNRSESTEREGVCPLGIPDCLGTVSAAMVLACACKRLEG
jgi:ADP-heptose:LPS heptosyltransferase